MKEQIAGDYALEMLLCRVTFYSMLYRNHFFCVFLLCFIPFVLSAQRYISGHVTDANDGNSLPAVHVFIANTTAGTTTDEKGYYRLQIPGEGSYRLAVSHVAYEPVFRDIEPGEASVVFDVSMSMHEMEEVTIAKTVRFRKRDIDLFWKTILGKSPSKKTIYVSNPEAVYYYYNSETQVLKVTCRVPLQIINCETGYQIQYVLDYFTHDYDAKVSNWDGQYMFEELQPDNYRQKRLWETNRKKVYQVSITNFIKSLYHDSLMENGFLLTYTGESVRFDNPLHHLLLADPKDYVSINPVDSCKTLYISPYSETLLLICFSKRVTDKDLGNVMFAQNGRFSWAANGLFRNELHTPGAAVRIFPDGTFKNTLNLSPTFYSKSLTGLDMTLPLEYNPYDSDAFALVTETGATTDHEFVTKIPLMSKSRISPLADTLDRVAKRFDMQLSVFPQEKIYLHTDKPYYISGERIWFRAHVVDAASHVPTTEVDCVYAELFDVRDSVVSRVKIGLENDAFSGHIPIPDDIPEGDYTIRAYTNFMQNLDEDYFFMKNVRIGHPMTRMMEAHPEFEFVSNKKIDAFIRFSPPPLFTSHLLTPEAVKISINDGKPMNVKSANGTARISFKPPSVEQQRVMLLDANCEGHSFRQYIKIPLPDDDFDVSFYPEGGSALYGCKGRIAFKAVQRDGNEIDIRGVVYDHRGNEIIRIKTDVRGMGQFMMTPDQGKRYYAICTNHKGKSKRFELPVAKNAGYALTSNWLKDHLVVEVRQPVVGKNDDTLCLIVHTRGVVQDIRILENTSQPVIFRKDFFLSGITHLLMLTKDMVPVSERLIFTNNNDQARVKCKSDMDAYRAKSPVEYTIIITDESGEPLQGNISVSVTDNHEVTIDTTANILTSILLSSDLRGNISNPAFYFRENAQSALGIELLMLTQGWRRYDVERIVRNDFTYPDTLLGKGYEISGTVKRNISRSRPEENANVRILSQNGDFFGNTFTDRNGRFYLHDGDAADSTWFIVQTVPKSGDARISRLEASDGHDLKLTLDKASYPARDIPVVPSYTPERNVFVKYADKAEQQYVIEH